MSRTCVRHPWKHPRRTRYGPWWPKAIKTRLSDPFQEPAPLCGLNLIFKMRCYSMVGPKKILLTFLPFPRPLRPLYDSDVCRISYLTQCSLLCTEEADNRYKGLTDQCGVGNGGEVGSQSWVKTYIWQSRQETFSRGDYQAFKTTFHVLKSAAINICLFTEGNTESRLHSDNISSCQHCHCRLYRDGLWVQW